MSFILPLPQPAFIDFTISEHGQNAQVLLTHFQTMKYARCIVSKVNVRNFQKERTLPHSLLLACSHSRVYHGMQTAPPPRNG